MPYENAIQDVTHHLEVREREFAVIDIPAESGRATRRPMRRRSLAPDARVERLEGGFYAISGAAVDAARHDLSSSIIMSSGFIRGRTPTVSTSCATIRWIP